MASAAARTEGWVEMAKGMFDIDWRIVKSVMVGLFVFKLLVLVLFGSLIGIATVV